MESYIRIRPSGISDLDDIMKVIEDGRSSLRKAGIPQWQNEYPSREDLKRDIQNGGSRVIVKDGKIAGTCFLLDENEKTYAVIEKGKWLNDEPYITIHRAAVLSSEKGHHLADLFIHAAEELAQKENIHSIRMDTHEKNLPMRSFLRRNMFQECGIIYVEDGTPRIAYQKILK